MGNQLQQQLTEAHNGNALAQFEVGRAYDSGCEGRRNSTEAARWYRKAAGAGHAQAADQLDVLKMGTHSSWLRRCLR